MAERFGAFSTDAEERWLVEGGRRPPRAAERLPPRGGVLIPACHHVGGPIEAERIAVRDRALVHRIGGQERVLARPGAVTRAIWLVDGAETAARLPVLPLGYLVLVAGAEPLLALRLADWTAGELAGAGSDLLRAAGFEALARELGVELEVNPAGVGGAAGFARGVAVLRPRPPRQRGQRLLAGAIPLLGLGLAAVLFALRQAAAAVAVLLVGTLALAGLDLLAAGAARRRIRRLPGRLHRWWAAGPPGVGLGLRSTRWGDELVVADGTGWECWLPGPAVGGAASLVLARDPDTDRPWGLLVFDRDERPLLALPAAAWLAGPDPAGALAGGLGPAGGADPTVSSAVGPAGGADPAVSSAVGPMVSLVVSTARMSPWPADRLHQGRRPAADLPPAVRAARGRTGVAAGLLLAALVVCLAGRWWSTLLAVAVTLLAVLCVGALAAALDPGRRGGDG